MYSTVERLQALIASGNFSWEKDGETLRDSLRIIQSLQAARVSAFETTQKTPIRQTIAIDAMRSVAVEVVGLNVNLIFMVCGAKAASQPIPAEASQALGGALTRAGLLASSKAAA